MREITLFVSHAEVSVSSAAADVAPALESLASLWQACRTPLVPAQRKARIEARAVERAGARGYEIALDGAAISTTDRREDLLPLLEAALYRVLHAGEPGCALLHAACVQYDDWAVVLLGPSGSGKSSLSLAAVSRGYRYLTDELTVSDGAQVWGVPRSIQFEATRRRDALPERLQQSDRELYPVRLDEDDAGDDAVGAVPVRSVLPHELSPTPCPASRTITVRLVNLARAEQPGAAEQGCEPIAPLAALAELHEATFGQPRVSLGALVGPGRGYRLSWDEPQSALQALEDALRGCGTWT